MFFMANIKDVAREAGVSVATVSRIMNNRGYISDATRKKVQEVMKRLDYQPNEMARYLQTKRSYTLGLILPYVNHPYFCLLTAAIAEHSYCRGYRLMLCASADHPERERDMVSMLRGNKVDGILVSSRWENGGVYEGSNLPVVSIERTIPRVPSVSCDNYNGGEMAARRLYDAGCRKLLMVGNRVQSFLPAAQRYDGFRDECQRLGVSCDLYEAQTDDLFVRAGFQNVLEQYPDVDGYFATGDMLAVRLDKALRDSGKVAAKDYCLIGFDGLDMSDCCDVTTVAQPIREMGETAVDLLIRRIEGETVPDETILPVHIIERRTTR